MNDDQHNNREAAEQRIAVGCVDDQNGIYVLLCQGVAESMGSAGSGGIELLGWGDGDGVVSGEFSFSFSVRVGAGVALQRLFTWSAVAVLPSRVQTKVSAVKRTENEAIG